MSEGKLFQCPSCGSTLSPEGSHAQVKCPYCGSIVIVPPELREVEPGSAQPVTPINIMMGQSGTSIQMPDMAGLQSKPINVVLGETELAGISGPMIAATTQWTKWAIWIFVLVMIFSVVVPLVCSLLGVMGAFGGIMLPFFLR